MTPQGRKRALMGILLLVVVMGWAWLTISTLAPSLLMGHTGFCVFKKLSGIPCPSCGTTRAIRLLLRGHVAEAAAFNPLGLVVLPAMILLPLGVGFDLATKRDRFTKALARIENMFRKPKIAIAFAVLIAANWIWNIYKHL